MFLTPNQLEQMADAQNKLNTLILGKDWATQDKDWELAVIMEAAEAIEHKGWKWWKHQEADIPQLQMELVDIMHFALSGVMAGPRDLSYTIDNSIVSSTIIGYDESHLVFLLKDIIGTVVQEGMGNHLLEAIQEAMVVAGMTGESVFKMYMSKNLLNIFRQENGYKEGTYQKIWNGKEDNEVLADLMETVDLYSSTFYNDLHSKLAKAYNDSLS